MFNVNIHANTGSKSFYFQTYHCTSDPISFMGQYYFTIHFSFRELAFHVVTTSSVDVKFVWLWCPKEQFKCDGKKQNLPRKHCVWCNFLKKKPGSVWVEMCKEELQKIILIWSLKMITFYSQLKNCGTLHVHMHTLINKYISEWYSPA